MSDVLKAIAVTAELTGTELTKAGLQAMEADLSMYAPTAVLVALTQCRRELKGKLTVASIIERIEANDGRPSSNQAWAVALEGFNEDNTVLTNQEINEAMAVARPIWASGDSVAARMAFKDAYDRIVMKNRELGHMPAWYPSLGSNVSQREAVVSKGVADGLLERKHYENLLLPAPANGGLGVMALLEDKSSSSEGLSPHARECIAKIKTMLRSKK